MSYRRKTAYNTDFALVGGQRELKIAENEERKRDFGQGKNFASSIGQSYTFKFGCFVFSGQTSRLSERSAKSVFQRAKGFSEAVRRNDPCDQINEINAIMADSMPYSGGYTPYGV